MKRRILTTVVLALAVVSAIALRSTPASAAGGCNCPKGKVCCYNCNGTFAYCGRSHAFCPECPAP